MFAMSKAFFALPADVKGRYGFDQVSSSFLAVTMEAGATDLCSKIRGLSRRAMLEAAWRDAP